MLSRSSPAFGQRDPDARGYYGAYGGRFVPETLVAPVAELEAAYIAARSDQAFRDELDGLLKHYVGRPTPLFEARRLRASLGGARLLLKREDRRNALSRAMVAELQQAFDDLYQEKRVRAVVLTGAGTAFCAGLDVHELRSLDELSDQEKHQHWGDVAEE